MSRGEMRSRQKQEQLKLQQAASIALGVDTDGGLRAVKPILIPEDQDGDEDGDREDDTDLQRYTKERRQINETHEKLHSEKAL